MSSRLRIAVVPGDGIGVDVLAEAVKALGAVADASGKSLALTPFDWGAERYLIACGLVGEPVPRVITSGGAQ